jgi:hypothetical protein
VSGFFLPIHFAAAGHEMFYEQIGFCRLGVGWVERSEATPVNMRIGNSNLFS